MRPVSFRSDELRSVLLRNQVATLDQLKQALGTPVDVTVFRKLQPLDYLTSYSRCRSQAKALVVARSRTRTTRPPNR
jgi:hypothetical protein